jgi:hypothetical protein
LLCGSNHPITFLLIRQSRLANLQISLAFCKYPLLYRKRVRYNPEP